MVPAADPPAPPVVAMAMTHAAAAMVLHKLRRAIRCSDQFEVSQGRCRCRVGGRKTEADRQNGRSNGRKNDTVHATFSLIAQRRNNLRPS